MNSIKISGFTYVRNGIKLQYPFVQAIRSILPVVDEMIVVVGDSTDGTRKAVENINDSRIKIIDTVWDPNMRKNGKIFAQQSNTGIDNITGNWAIHIQADEVIHEKDIHLVKKQILASDNNKQIDGLLMPFLHFWGDYQHIRKTRGTHRFEIRAFRNEGLIRSYRDSQGFRKYKNIEEYEQGKPGTKLKVVMCNAAIYHYSYVRNPEIMSKKAEIFSSYYNSETEAPDIDSTNNTVFDYNKVDKLEPFYGEHPIYMKEVIKKKNWEFTYDPSQSNIKFRHKLLNKLADITGLHPFEYRNYILIPGNK